MCTSGDTHLVVTESTGMSLPSVYGEEYINCRRHSVLHRAPGFGKRSVRRYTVPQGSALVFFFLLSFFFALSSSPSKLEL